MSSPHRRLGSIAPMFSDGATTVTRTIRDREDTDGLLRRGRVVHPPAAATFDEVHDPDARWSDRCYFFAASPDGTPLVTNGYGNNPNSGTGLGYGKVSLADGRHWDLIVGRR